MTLYQAAWKLFLCFLAIIAGFGGLWLALELVAGYFIDRADEARENAKQRRRINDYNRIAQRYGRTVR